MLNKFTLLISCITIIFIHIAIFILYKSEEKKIVIAEKPSINHIALRKVVLKQKEIKKVEENKEIKKPTLPKKVEPKVEKIVKKAKRKIPKKTPKKIEKEPKVVEKKIKEIKKENTIKVEPTVTKKVISPIKKEVIISNVRKDMIQNEYLSKLRKTIENNKTYPKRAKRLKQQGRVVVSFEITKDGLIKKILLKDSCPYKRLNIAAVELLEQIAKFEPIPKELGKNSWTIEVPINYSIVNI